MEFQLFHEKFFNAYGGAYSIVTDREEYDSQITLTDAEAEMVINFFGRNNINIGNVASNKLKSQKTFLLYPNLNQIKLNLVFPKPHKTELRLYLSSRAGFKPKPGEIWFLYLNTAQELVIGSLPYKIWNDLDQLDIEDNDYLDEIQETIYKKGAIIKAPPGRIIKKIIGPKITYARNPLIAVASLTTAKFSCEIDSAHKTFIAQKTNDPYVEAHHFIPMKFQSDFKFALDCIENIISLCPNCHRGIHLGIPGYKKNLIEVIYKKRGSINNFEIENLYSFYNLLMPAIN